MKNFINNVRSMSAAEKASSAISIVALTATAVIMHGPVLAATVLVAVSTACIYNFKLYKAD